ncbi:class D sortase [Tenuibacillus multivorans]|uniref:Sortase A n=1 Tax=Tenuibacillus multivorans TaxID=237069 RepID=A0A1G9WWR6_9BACI|nr:class D sortase [Tenuibacillus multivorans]GEL78408.1 hypothetical protein TMU01_26430 [Tenuibacillus multivorans]SDM88515.1 sortase A [Tenuibacillus multivorans]
MKRFIAVLLMLIGIGLIVFPHVQKQIYASQEKQLVEEFQQLDDLFESQSREEIQLHGDDPQGEPNASIESPQLSQNVVGLLHIDKINLTLPLLKGATEENLNIGAGILNETDPLGEVGNTGIAAHRAYKHGRLFNRLDEMRIGDRLTVETLEGEIKYVVFQTEVVLPNDVSVLKSNAEESIITLITCEPIYNPTHRLIVQAKRVSENAS